MSEADDTAADGSPTTAFSTLATRKVLIGAADEASGINTLLMCDSLLESACEQPCVEVDQELVVRSTRTHCSKCPTSHRCWWCWPSGLAQLEPFSEADDTAADGSPTTAFSTLATCKVVIGAADEASGFNTLLMSDSAPEPTSEQLGVEVDQELVVRSTPRRTGAGGASPLD
jgi:hypothetical protein